VLPQTAPLIIVAQYCLFRTFNDAPHWFVAWAVFTVGNSAARVLGVGLFGEHVSNWPLALTAITIMMGGALLLKRSLL
jgi:hemolysin-activating ACP:hemolysin acyltransferase